MNITTDKKGLKITNAKCFSLRDTLECGQIFRYSPAGGGFSVFSKDKHCYAEQRGDEVSILTDDPAYFRRFFAVDEDYPAAAARLRAFAELTDAVDASCGIRLLRQDPFETIVSFIVSANNNIPRIKGIIERICAAAGHRNDGGYAFPTRDELCRLSVEDFTKLGAGYRAPYLFEVARAVTDDFINEVNSSELRVAVKKLLTVKGVGPKVADCILLFGFGFGDTFPVDVWMKHALATEELDTDAKIRAYYTARYGKLSGLAQQYIYHYNRNVLPRK